METNFDINKVDEKIQDMTRLMEELKAMSDDVPALNRNLVRLSASIKMLTLNFSDLVHLDSEE